jgi:DMSO reductase anchor subunit
MNTDLSPFMKYLPLLIPLVLLQLGLQIWALVDLARREATNGPKWLWAVIIVLGELVGPVVYFIAGRKE